MTGGGSATGGGVAIGGGSATGGGAPTGGGAATGGGFATGGGSATGGGVATGGGFATGGGGAFDAGRFFFGDGGLTVEELLPYTGSIRPEYDRVSARANNDVFVANSYGFIDHYDGTQWRLAYDRIGASFRFGGLEVLSDGRVFAAGDVYLVSCRGSCTDAGSWRTKELTPSTAFLGVCAGANNVYAVGNNSTAGGVVYRFEPADGGWSNLGLKDAGTRFSDCAVTPDGTLFISAKRDLVRVFTDGGVSRVDLVRTGLVVLENWNAIEAVGDGVYAAGDEKRIARFIDGGWQLVLDRPVGDLANVWRGLARGRPGELIATGGRGTSAPLGFVNGDVTELVRQFGPVDFTSAWSDGANSVFLTAIKDPSGTREEVVFKVTR